jgi:putative membrane protein
MVMMIYQHSMGPAGWLWMAFVLITLTALLVGAIAAGVRTLDRPASEQADGAPAGRVLAERFARGDITEEEYHHRLAVLRAARH